jgi:integrase
MKCKKCRKQIPDDSKFCNYCGVPQEKKKMYRRPDGLYEKIVVIDGKRTAFRGKTEKEVEQKMIEYQGKKETGPLFNEVAAAWKDEHFPALAYNTLRSYKPAYNRAIDFFEGTYIKEIKQTDIKSYIAKFPRTWALKTYKNYFLVLNLIFEYAASDGIIDNNPAEYIQLPKGLNRTYRRAPTPEEIEIIKNSTDKTFGLFAYFLLYTGCRRGEALALKYKDIDRKEKIIHITKSIYHEGNTPRVKQPKTDRGKRDIILLDVLAKRLPKGKPNDYIFGDGGNPLTASRAEDFWIYYQRETGMDSITPHIVRHGYATILHEAGIDPKDAQDMLGHANISTTLDIYTHITKKRRYETADKLNQYTKSTQ